MLYWSEAPSSFAGTVTFSYTIFISNVGIFHSYQRMRPPDSNSDFGICIETFVMKMVKKHIHVLKTIWHICLNMETIQPGEGWEEFKARVTKYLCLEIRGK